MICFTHFISLLTLLLPTLVNAQCPTCDSYAAALKSCQSASIDVTTVGSTMDAASIECMCKTKSNAADMNSCIGCWEVNPTSYFNDQDGLSVTTVTSWQTTCKADNQFGDKQAVACWEGQPSDSLPCFEKDGGSGSGSGGGTSLGGSDSSPSASSPAERYVLEELCLDFHGPDSI